MGNYCEILTELGKPPLWLRNKVCVLPFSGRVMGLYPEKGRNVLWTNPALNSLVEARQLLSDDVWTNLGGDRTWISPEIELFIKDMSRPMETYQVPAAVDPGDYQVLRFGDNEVELETAITVDFFRSGGKVNLKLRKRIIVLDKPNMPFKLPAGVTGAGYKVECELSATEPLPGSVHPAIWNLLQVPGGGEIVVPIADGAKPVDFFGKPQYQLQNNNIRAAVPAALGYKFGVRPENCTGMMFYLNLSIQQPFIIVRQFEVKPDGGYFDVPYTAPKQPGCVQQVYVDDGTYGGFGEMEHHSPAILPGIRNKITDTCTTWAFAGTVKELEKLIKKIVARQG